MPPPLTAATFTNVREKPFVHLWFDPSIRWPSFTPGVLSCRLCGACKPRDPSRQTSGCKGVVRVTLRDYDPRMNYRLVFG